MIMNDMITICNENEWRVSVSVRTECAEAECSIDNPRRALFKNSAAAEVPLDNEPVCQQHHSTTNHQKWCLLFTISLLWAQWRSPNVSQRRRQLFMKQVRMSLDLFAKIFWLTSACRGNLATEWRLRQSQQVVSSVRKSIVIVVCCRSLLFAYCARRRVKCGPHLRSFFSSLFRFLFNAFASN